MKTKSLCQSFRCALAGLVYVLRTQRNARIHLVIAVTVVLMAAFLDRSLLDLAILVLTIGVVFAAEIGNTVVEAIVDLVSPEYDDLAKVAKDAAAAAVLCLATISIAVGLLVLGQPLYERLFG